jgi:hypothetical protein
MEPAVVDSEKAALALRIDVDETFAETDVFDGIILLALDGGGHNQFE